MTDFEKRLGVISDNGRNQMAEDRAWQLFSTSLSEIPELAVKYLESLSRKTTTSSDGALYAFAAYAHIVEGLEYRCSSNSVLTEDEEFFRKLV